MKYTPQEALAKATQKRSQYAKHGYGEVRIFKDWLNARLLGMQKDGATIKTCTVEGIYYISIAWGTQKPKIFTDSDFRTEYEDTYLASYGLNCKIRFEENAGLVIA